MLAVLLLNSRSLLKAQLTSMVGSGLPDIGRGEARFADFNNDGKLDVLIIGQTNAYNVIPSSEGFVSIYLGNGDGTFTDATSTWFSTSPTIVGGGILGIADYNKDGYIDFAYAGYNSTDGRIFKLYKNNNGTGFVDVTNDAFANTTAPTGIYTGSIVWGDIDNDGDLDLLKQGRTYTSLAYPTSSGQRVASTQLYKNNGDGTFTLATSPSVAVCYGQVLFTDLDNDGDLDVMYSGGGNIGGLWKNDGTGTFTDVGTGSGTVTTRGSNAILTDFNKDGKVDILQSYINTSGTPAPAFRLYINNYNPATWTSLTVVGQTDVYGIGGTQATTNPGMLSAADYDNDGDVDYTIQGIFPTNTGNPTTVLYLNDGAKYPTNPTFSSSGISLNGLHYGGAIWGDVNGDKKLDLLTFGYSDVATTSPKTYLYINGVSAANNPPAAPNNLAASISGYNVILSWAVNKADDHTNDTSLTYAIRIGKTKGSADIVMPMSDLVTGKRKIVARGEIDTTVYQINDLLPGKYYWSVQAIDDNYEGGAWATEDSFVVNDITVLPTTQATMTATPGTAIGQIQLTLNWTNGSGYKAAVFVKKGNDANDSAVAVINKYYTPNTQFGLGDTINGGWYCVYNASVKPLKTSNVTITGLEPVTSYQFMVLSYNASADKSIINYNNNKSTNNPVIISTIDYTVPTTVFTAIKDSINTTGYSVGLFPTLNANVSYPCVMFMKVGNNASDPITLTNNTTYNDGGRNFGLGTQIENTGWYCVLNGQTTYRGSGKQYVLPTISNLTPHTTYQVRICTYNGIPGYEKYSATVSYVFTTPDVLPPTIQDSSLSISQISDTTINISWVKGNGTFSVILLSQDTNAVAPVLKDSIAYSVGSTIDSWTFIFNGSGNSASNIKIPTGIKLKMLIYGYNGVTPYERYLLTTENKNTLIFKTVLPAVIIKEVTDIKQTNAIVSWNAVNKADGYKIDVASDDAFTTLIIDNADVKDTLRYMITGLNASTDYYVRIRAYNNDGTGSNSIAFKFTTLINPPAAPVASAATDILKTTTSANWNASATATGYILDVAKDSLFTNFVEGFNAKDVKSATSYTITGLTAYTDYYYRVRAYNAGGIGENSNTIYFKTMINAPIAPVAKASTNITQTSFAVNWDSAATALGYYIDIATDDAFGNIVEGYNNVNVGNVRTYQVTGLSSNSNYYFRVRGYNAGGTGENSNVIKTTTLPYPPAAPVATSATNILQTSFTAKWNATSNTTGYKLDVATDSAFTSILSGYNDLDVANVKTYAITGLTAATKYYFRVRSYNAGGVSANSNIISVVTLKNPPVVPVAVAATNITLTGFTANWNAADGANGYYIDVAYDSVFNFMVNNFENRDVANVTSIAVPELNENTTYYYRVRAYNEIGTTANSNVISVTTLKNTIEISDANIIGVYPNPSNGKFFINTGNLINSTVQIIDIQGRIIYENILNNAGINQFDINEKGIFVVKVISGDNVFISKLTIQ
jgi:hypothetical protein